MTYFERLFKECIQFDYLSLHFIENNIFKSDIFKLLSSKLQKELKTFCKEILKKNLEQISVLTNDLRLKENVVDSQAILSSEKNKSSYVSNVHFFEKNDHFEHVQQEPVAKMAFLSTNVSHFVKKENNELLVCINSVNKTIEFYDPYHHKWHLSPLSLQLPNNQQYFQLSLIGSVMYAFGGKDNNNEITNKMWSRDLSDPTSQWTARASMYHSRFVFANVIINNTNYVLGGWGKSDSHLFSCERYDSQLNQWSTMTDMNSGRSAASAAVFNDCIYIAGGWSEGFERSVEKYCPQDNIWRKVAPMTIARKHFVLTPFAGRLWAIGGVAYGLDSLSSCESYDPMTDTWQKATYLNMGRWLHAAIEFNGELYVVGGNRNSKIKKIKNFLKTNV